MLSRLRNGQGGFSLVELLVVMLVSGVLGTIVVGAIVSSTRAASVAEERIHALNDLQMGLERVGRELRAADPLVLDANDNYQDGVTARIVRDGQRVEYTYYLVDVGDSAELREDVRRETLDGTVVQNETGLFIADIANLETDTVLFTYYRRDPATREIVEIDCDGVSQDVCRNRHLDAVQIRVTLEKLLPDQRPIVAETVVNIRSTRVD